MISQAEARETGLRFWKMALILAGLSLISILIYIGISKLTYRVGFPLDDAWIHQTYARNLANLGEWSFIPGQPSGGSTSPLWSVILAIGYKLNLGPYIWTYALGWVCLTTLAVAAEYFLRKLIKDYRPSFPWAGTVFLLEWHLVWAAGSGMETILYTSVISLALFLLVIEADGWKYFGFATGIAIWIRPDGISLLGPILLALVLRKPGLREGIRFLSWILGGFLVLFLPYLAFNHIIAGSWWPNTFYAKQAEYASLQQLPLISRLGSELFLPLVGPGVLLLPGALFFVWKRGGRSQAAVLPVILWFLGYIGLYAWRLPVTFQHGRYIQPAMPILFFLGLAGLIEYLHSAQGRIAWITKRAWVIALACTVIIFWGLGASSYATDTAIIESEMVDTAKWVAGNTGPGSLIAAHDIGALGYFADRNIIDLAGLISPEVIPFIRDEAKISEFLTDKKVDYLMTFPDWYPKLVSGVPVLYKSPGKFAPQKGQPNMSVYLWNNSEGVLQNEP